MSLNILLVNPNRFKNPPVIPLGLEYLVNVLEKHNHNVDILDLCFSESPEDDLTKALLKKKYNIVGFTIRNIDSINYFNSEFYLPSIKALIQCVKKLNIPVVLGGSGFSAMPKEVLDYLEADYGIIGPGEIIFPRFLELLGSQELRSKIYDGWQYGTDAKLIHLRGKKINYAKYLSGEEIIGFETHKGCPGKCPFCVSACSQTWYRKIPAIIEELKLLIHQGHTHFQLCDSEFNSDLNFSIQFCRALIEKRLTMKWKLFMKPYPYNEKLFKLLQMSNAYSIGITIFSDKKIQELNNYSYDDLEKIIEYCTNYQIELTIDSNVGYPYESFESIKNMIRFFKTHRPTIVTVNPYFRVYKHTQLANLIKADISIQKNLIKPHPKDLDLLKPVFYNQVNYNILEELISDDELFRIAWLTADK
ncbi:MAG: B12-binding domain-containing radical SAM protein [Candidatus Hodarchaeota archaeon]